MDIRYAFIGAVLPLLGLGGCASTPLATGPCMSGSRLSTPGNLLVGFQSVSYDEQCGRDSAVQTFIASPDIGVRTTGMIVAAQADTRITEALPVAQEAIANPNGTVRCTAGTPAAGSMTVPFSCAAPLILIQRGTNTSTPANTPKGP